MFRNGWQRFRNVKQLRLICAGIIRVCGSSGTCRGKGLFSGNGIPSGQGAWKGVELSKNEGNKSLDRALGEVNCYRGVEERPS